MDIEKRMENIEGNYGRMADSMARIAGNVETQTQCISDVKRGLVGHYDKDKNKYIDGVIQRTEDLEKVVKNRRNIAVKAFITIKEILIPVLLAWIIFRQGW
jgi:hypothetical protein